MKKLIVILVVAAMSWPVGLLAQTNTTTIAELQAKVVELIAQLENLKQRIENLRAGGLADDTPIATRFSKQLRLGDAGEEVTRLQRLLASDVEIYPEGLVTGYYGPLTKKAVERLQEKFGLERVGELGPLTRKALSRLRKSDLKKILIDKDEIDDDWDEEEEDGDDDEDDDNDGIKKAHRVVICHTPPDNLTAKRTIVVGSPAVQAHLEHGDTLGKCGDDDGYRDTISPALSNLRTANITSTGAVIGWQTNERATSRVWYNTVNPPEPLATSTLSVGSNGLVANHNITLNNLTASTTYYYYAGSVDAAGNFGTSTVSSFSTLVQ